VTPHAAKILAHLDALNEHLFDCGFPRMSAWWRETIGRWYESGKPQLVTRVGRRGGKSSSLTRLAVVEAVYGEHRVPPGDVGVVAIVSARRTDAMERLRTIRAILDALGVRYTEKAESIELTGRGRSFAVFTASIAGVSGFTSIWVLLDEVAKMRDSDTGANPAAVVISSIRPTMATQANARMVLSSSPMGMLDAHADAFAQGETSFQCIAHAPSWVANPSLTEAGTHALEPDEAVWSREFAAIPQAEAETSLLSSKMLDKCIRPTLDVPPEPRHVYTAAIDPATRGNAWTLVVACLSDGGLRRVVMVRDWTGTKGVPLSPGDVFRQIVELIEPYGLKYVHSDQFAEDAMRELAKPHGLQLLVDKPWSQSVKADAYDTLRSLMQSGKVELPNDPVLRNDMLGVRVKLTRAGTTYELASQGTRHSDYAPAVAMAVSLCRTPCQPLVMPQTTAEQEEAFRNEFLLERERARRRAERHGALPVTHRYGRGR